MFDKINNSKNGFTKLLEEGPERSDFYNHSKKVNATVGKTIANLAKPLNGSFKKGNPEKLMISGKLESKGNKVKAEASLEGKKLTAVIRDFKNSITSRFRPSRKGEQNQRISSIASEIIGFGTYLDMGVGESLLQNAICWSDWQNYPHGYYPVADLNAQLDSIFQPLSQDGSNQINLSFAQISNILKILNADPSLDYSGDDKILEILTWTGGTENPIFNLPIVNSDGSVVDMDIITYITTYAKETYGISSDLSFGGAVATDEDYVIGDPTQAAKNLAQLMDKYNIDSVDFDIEDINGLMQNGNDPVTFLETLKQELSGTGKQVHLTVLGSVSLGPQGALKPIFDKFDACADSVRLMLYSNDQFYLDADNQDWGLNNWQTYVDPSKISIGFYDSIAYEDPQSSDPDYSAEKYEGFPSNPTRAEAAVWIYIKVLSEMGLDISKMAEPFLWTDTPTAIKGNKFFEEFGKDLNQSNKKLNAIEANPKRLKQFTQHAKRQIAKTMKQKRK